MKTIAIVLQLLCAISLAVVIEGSPCSGDVGTCSEQMPADIEVGDAANFLQQIQVHHSSHEDNDEDEDGEEDEEPGQKMKVAAMKTITKNSALKEMSKELGQGIDLPRSSNLLQTYDKNEERKSMPSVASNLSRSLPSYAVDQCSNPLATVTTHMTMPENGARRRRRWIQFDTQNDWRGKCVKVQWRDWDNDAWHSINVKVGRTLPNPGSCSDIAKQYNGGGGSWDFSGTGYCGKGDCKDLVTNCHSDVQSTANFHHGRLACIAHDVCVWARCQEDSLKPSFADALGSDLTDWFHTVTDEVQAESILRAGDPICGRALLDTMSAFNDATNSRIQEFKDGNSRPSWWNRRRWR